MTDGQTDRWTDTALIPMSRIYITNARQKLLDYTKDRYVDSCEKNSVYFLRSEPITKRLNYRRQVCHVVGHVGVRQWRHLLNVSVKLSYLLAVMRQVFGKQELSRRRILRQAHNTSTTTLTKHSAVADRSRSASSFRSSTHMQNIYSIRLCQSQDPHDNTESIRADQSRASFVYAYT